MLPPNPRAGGRGERRREVLATDASQPRGRVPGRRWLQSPAAILRALRALVLLALLVAPAVAASAAAGAKPVDIYLFWSAGCPHCGRTIAFLDQLSARDEALPVVPLVASRNQGVTALIAAAETLARSPDAFRPARPEIAAPHRDVLAQVRVLLGTHLPLPYDSDWIALKLLEGDSEITGRARVWLLTGKGGKLLAKGDVSAHPCAL